VTITIALTIGVPITLKLTGSTDRASTSSESTGTCGGTQRCSSDDHGSDEHSIEIRLKNAGLQTSGQVQHDGSTCADHAYGTVQTFFREHPCAGLYRAQLQVRDAAGDVVLLAVSWVRMGDEPDATAYHKLVDSPGTGNITELSRESGPYRAVRYTGLHYRSGQNGVVVINAQAEPAAARWTGPALKDILGLAVQ